MSAFVSDGQVRPPSVTPVVVSAMLCPGAGQCMQGRWPVGLLFGAVFLACFMAFMVYALGVIAGLYRFAAGFFAEVPPEAPVGKAVVAFTAAMLVYCLSLLDTYLAYLRQRSRYAQWRADSILSQ